MRFSRYADMPVDEKLVLFESFKGKHYADNPKAIYEYMLTHDDFKDYHFVWCLRGKAIEESSIPKEDPRTEVVAWGSDEYYKAYARAKYWIPNTRIPEAIKKKESQVYLQCMHGTPLKRTGIDTKKPIDKSRETTMRVIHKDVSRYTYLISQSEYFTEVIKSAFDLKRLGQEGVIREIGYPRNDKIAVHTQEDVENARKRLGISEGKRVFLYAPTFRDDNRKERYEYREPLDFKRLLNQIPEDVIILFRTHYFISQAFDFEEYDGRIIDVSDYPDINDLYIISDVLITDYSSVMFDYSILHRPIIYFMYDLPHYRDSLRGFYFNVDELPGPIVTEQEELEKVINGLDEWAYTDEQKEKLAAFQKKFAPFDDGLASKRAAELVLAHEQ